MLQQCIVTTSQISNAIFLFLYQMYIKLSGKWKIDYTKFYILDPS